ncbi:AbrB/MazE/SpoVT family DNA-binding domain-containing protein [Lachnospira multipara]|uniref:Antitoxin MazE n=1 Tax=Lachnospira multipara TaxID=28051 RepID=A0A1H5VVC5_9FIRM|nr:AbrB/MazE/SpoVT family DNA-binding domain-containing protein [Lachnospira multipara]SEF91245.1 antitoxin MazE [Lachnospira multipara]
MQILVSKWGDSLGIRVPINVVNALSIKSGDILNYEIRDNQLILSKEISTKEMFEKFYNRPMEKITIDDVGKAEVIDWEEDIGDEIF